MGIRHKTRCLVVEFLTAGGAHCPDFKLAEVPNSLRHEALLMLETFVACLARSRQFAVSTLIDASVQSTSQHDPPTNLTFANVQLIKVAPGQFKHELIDQVGKANHVILIAPENDQIAEQCCGLLSDYATKLISPDIELTKLAGDKKKLNDFLATARVPVPENCGIANPNCFMKKPRWGAGGVDMKILTDVKLAIGTATSSEAYIVEPYVSGHAASVSVIRGPNQTIFLPATFQQLEFEGKSNADFGVYKGSRYPLPIEMEHRAQKLARLAVVALPTFVGYIGIDMVMAKNPKHDCIVDINPRLTSSYVLLEKVCTTNLAEAIVKISLGESVELIFDSKPHEFSL